MRFAPAISRAFRRLRGPGSCRWANSATIAYCTNQRRKPLTPPSLPGGGDFPVDFVVASTAEPARLVEFANQLVRKAYASETPARAKRRLLDLAGSLADHPGAVASLREGLEETLTLLELGVRGTLALTLVSTNPIENLMDTLGRVSRNVKRWRHGRMALRWAVTGMLEARKAFRRVKGYRELPALLRALEFRVAREKVIGLGTKEVA